MGYMSVQKTGLPIVWVHCPRCGTINAHTTRLRYRGCQHCGLDLRHFYCEYSVTVINLGQEN